MDEPRLEVDVGEVVDESGPEQLRPFPRLDVQDGVCRFSDLLMELQPII